MMFEKFLKITGFNIETFFREFVYFIEEKSQKIIDYYSGLEVTMDRDSFDYFLYLKKNSNYVLDLFSINYGRFDTVDFWQLLEASEDIKIKLETIEVFYKFARSSVKGNSFANEISLDVPMRENESVEDLVIKLGSTDKEEDWVNLALQNSLIQEDYSRSGGRVISAKFFNNEGFKIESIVDSTEGEKIKGVDIQRKLEFFNNDLKTLSYDETLKQSLDINLELLKNDNPEFPEYGVDKTLISGVTYKELTLPSFLRQLFQTMSTEDIISDIQLVNTVLKDNMMLMEMEIMTKSGEQQNRVLNIK